MCLATAKQGQLKPSTKNNRTRNTIQYINDVKDQEITLKNKRNTVKCTIQNAHNMDKDAYDDNDDNNSFVYVLDNRK
jgi:hypothetical protein